VRTLPVALALAAIIGSAPLLAADSRQDELRDNTLAAIAGLDERGQKIAQNYLKDRVAGKPVSCVPRMRLRRSAAASDDVLMYDDGAVVYVNTPYLGCPRARDNVLISVSPSAQMCSGDIIQVADVQVGIPLASCTLNQFVPFRKPKTGG